MSFDADLFRRLYIQAGESPGSARSYVAYLNRADALLGGIDETYRLADAEAIVLQAQALPPQSFGGTRQKRDSLSALRKYAQLMMNPSRLQSAATETEASEIAYASPVELESLLVEIRNLAGRYYRATGKPLGVTGEIAELAAAEKLGLELAPARTAGYDALDHSSGFPQHVQIKGRAIDPLAPYRGRCPSIKCGKLFDYVLLVLLDKISLLPLEIWKADEAAVVARLAAPGSKSRNERNAMGISQFRSIATLIWSNRPGTIPSRRG